MVEIEREAQRQLEILRDRAVDLVSEGELLQKLRRSLQTGVPLRVKLGLDPTAPDLHLGHTVVLHKLREFQELGHQVICLIGDFTGLIGDPSGRSETRKPLTAEEISGNAETYRRQLSKILEPERTLIDFNSRWLRALGAEGLIQLAAKHTVARMLERDDFHKRYTEGRPISIHEFLYPLLQGYDSVMLQADVELGGTDQHFNLLVGRDLQRDHGQEPQVILTLPILEGLDGVQKMSKSLGNYIGIDEEPREMFGKAMSIPDHLIARYFDLVSGLPRDEVAALRQGLGRGTIHPREAKGRLAKTLVGLYHSGDAAEEAAAEFDRVFREKGLPTEIESLVPPAEAVEEGSLWIVRLLALSGAVRSHSEARRLVQQGGVDLDGAVVRDEGLQVPMDREHILKVGKRRFFRVVPPAPKKPLTPNHPGAI